jgi:hypothetical protein
LGAALKRTGRRIIGSPFVILFFDENAPGFRRAVWIFHIRFFTLKIARCAKGHSATLTV